VNLHPSVGDGWPDVWAGILQRIERLRPERIVPGHGPVGPGSYLAQERRYLTDLQRTVARAVREGTSLRTLQALPVPERYRSWRSSFFYPENLARQYRLATTKAARPTSH
jgi:glyoxylase-like metal-dependent hydrolase (beta-lactamase superfamily II)